MSGAQGKEHRLPPYKVVGEERYQKKNVLNIMNNVCDIFYIQRHFIKNNSYQQYIQICTNLRISILPTFLNSLSFHYSVFWGRRNYYLLSLLYQYNITKYKKIYSARELAKFVFKIIFTPLIHYIFLVLQLNHINDYIFSVNYLILIIFTIVI